LTLLSLLFNGTAELLFGGGVLRPFLGFISFDDDNDDVDDDVDIVGLRRAGIVVLIRGDVVDGEIE